MEGARRLVLEEEAAEGVHRRAGEEAAGVEGARQ